VRAKVKSFIASACLLLLSTGVSASHIVGGYIRYECQGPVSNSQVEYRVILTIYRDIVNANINANFPLTDSLTIYDGNNNFFALSLFTRTSLKTFTHELKDPCLVLLEDLQVEEAVYEATVNLPMNRDFKAVYQRCCRNNLIDNLQNPTAQGNTFMIDIPSYNSLGGCNSSPKFKFRPPIAFCPDLPLENDFDLSVIDWDSVNNQPTDSIVYSLCAPLNSPEINGPLPIPATPPPYSPVNYTGNFFATFPLPANPALSIDPVTGILTGTPEDLGVSTYVVGVCVEEYRNGVLLTTTRRDIQITIANCNPVIVTAALEQITFFDGLEEVFTNLTENPPGYTIRGYKWDFGDPTTLADTVRTTRADSVSYRYPAAGIYQITLIANPGLRCTDTVVKTFEVAPTLVPDFTIGGNRCKDNNAVDFSASGLFESYATFNWQFGPFANTGSATTQNVNNISFNNTDNEIPVSLTIEQDGCSRSITKNVNFFNPPIANFTLSPDTGCAPLKVAFTNRSFIYGSADYFWEFGDGNTSTARNPVHTYSQDSTYDVRLTVNATDKCIASDDTLFPAAVDVGLQYAINDIRFDFFPKIGCQPLAVTISDSSLYEGEASYFWDFQEISKDTFYTTKEPTHVYTDTGTFDIGLTLITKKCIDTINTIIPNAVKVLLKPEAQLVIPEKEKPKKEATFFLDASQSKSFSEAVFLINDEEIKGQQIINFTLQDTGTYQVKLIVENEVGCSDTVSATVYVYDEFEFIIPNIFTPNGDRVNDDFKIRACGVYEYEIEIFNRYGLPVFKSHSLNHNWDGRINGKVASSGVYYYLIRIKDFQRNYRKYQGQLTLLDEK
jgi:gliding motility-associated-like protein